MAMKKSTVVGALFASVSPIALLIGSPAIAADMGLKARPAGPPPAPAFSWTGCYVGAHVGWGWGRNNFSEQSATTAVTSGSESTFTTSSFGAASGRVDSSGGMFGGQVGCNYQFAPNWVAGIQGDFAGTDINGKATDPLGLGNSVISVKTEWLASITGRLGVTAFNNVALFYAKGGVAWDRNQWDLSNAANFFNSALFSETRTGWTIGGGVEWAFLPNWTAFAEFNYYDFSHGGSNAAGTNTTTTSCGIICTTSTTTSSVFSTGKQQIEAVKVGVNYKFGP
jgi:outer membrane immunogenic protein